jgi:negative regulator of flagellin synthesis FlgM
MAEIKLGPVPQVGASAIRVITAAPAGPARAVPASTNGATTSTTEGAPGASATQALDAGGPPVDAERVQSIRRAIEHGSYPLIPARVGDAMIAAGIMLRSPQA